MSIKEQSTQYSKFLKPVLKGISGMLSGNSIDYLGQETVRVKAQKLLEPVVMFSYNFEPDLGSRLQKKDRARKAGIRRSQRLNELKTRREYSDYTDFYLKSVFREDNPAWFEIPLDEQLEYQLSKLAEKIDFISPMSEENPSRINSDQNKLSPTQLTYMKEWWLRSRKRDSETEDQDEHDLKKSIYEAYHQYFQYYLWKAKEIERPPELNTIKYSTGLLEELPIHVRDFCSRVLPALHVQLIKQKEAGGGIISTSERHHVYRKQASRLITTSMGQDLTEPHLAYDDEFTRWRLVYKKTSEKLGISNFEAESQTGPELNLRLPDLNHLKSHLQDELNAIMADRDTTTLIMGISGDLDSAMLCALTAEVIRDFNLPYAIEAFYMQKDYHASRAKRITDLIDYLNRAKENPIVNFHVYNMANAYELLIQAVISRNGNFTTPTVDFTSRSIRIIAQAAIEAANRMTRFGTESQKKRRRIEYGVEKESPKISKLTELIIRTTDPDQLKALAEYFTQEYSMPLVPPSQLIHFIARIMADQSELLGNEEDNIDAREQSNLIHELLVAIRGHLCRHVKYPLTVSGQQFSELTTDNLTTSDTFVSWFPFANYPKSLLLKSFTELIGESNGKISLKDWQDRALQYLVPYYPDNMRVEVIDGIKILSRTPWFLNEFTQVTINPDRSSIPNSVWDNIDQEEGQNYIRIDGNIQWYLDPYLHYFMIHGLSEKSLHKLIERYPSKETDIRLAVFLMAAAREKRQKDIYEHKTILSNDKFTVK